MLNKRFFVLVLLVVMALVLSVVAVQADDTPATGDVVVRVFLDANNDVNDAGENGLEGWTIRLTPGGYEAVTGPNGFASFRDVEIRNYSVRVIANPQGNPPYQNGWRLARANADSVLNPHKYFIVGQAHNITASDFVTRVNGDAEAWVRFSLIRVNRITVGGAAPGDVIEFTRASDGRLIETRIANQGGWASVVGGGFVYGETFYVTNTNSGEQFMVTIPFGYQPNVNFATDTCRRCG